MSANTRLIWQGDRFISGPRAQRLQRHLSHLIADEAHGAIGKREVRAADVQAAEGVEAIVLADRTATDGVDRHATGAVRVAHVVDDAGGRSPGAPIPGVDGAAV